MTFNGQRLRTARLAQGWSQQRLAEEASCTQAFVSLLERGGKAPSRQVLEAMAEALQVQPEFFSGESLPSFDACHFRRASRTPVGVLDEVRARGQLFCALIDELEASVDWPSVDVPRLAASSREEIEAAAETVRRRWRLRLDEPLAKPIHEVENHGVVVVEFRGVSERVDAFSRWGKRPAIVLSTSKDSVSRTVFNVGHELGHLVLHREPEQPRKILEDQANYFAGAFLLPRAGFVREFPRSDRIRWHVLFAMKARWKTSVAAMVRRAHELGLIGARAYRGANVHIRRKGWHRGEPDEPQLESPALVTDGLQLLAGAGVPPVDVAGQLGWRVQLLERIAGAPVPVESNGDDDAAEVLSLDELRVRRARKTVAEEPEIA